MVRPLAILICVLSSTTCFAALSTSFEDLQLTTPTTTHKPGSSLLSQGIKFTIVPYPYSYPLSVTSSNYAKGGGKELFMGAGIGVAVSMPPMTSQVTFKFGQYNPWNGLTINGQSTSRPQTIRDMNGISLGGVSVAVSNSSSTPSGTVTLIGAIDTLTIGGMELAIDDLSITAPVTNPAFANFNGDTIVDGRDFLRWQRNLGKASAIRSDGDADNDQDVDRADLTAWRYYFGNSVSAAEAVAVVPEPAAIIMAAIPVIALSGVRRSRLA